MHIGPLVVYRAPSKQQMLDEKNKRQEIQFEFQLSRIDAFGLAMRDLKDVPGAIVECGTGHAFSLVMILKLRKVLRLEDRPVFSCDSFGGFPGANLNRGNLERVKKRLKIANVPEPTFVVGYFNETLPTTPFQQIAFLHIDVDLGPSYTEVLTNLWPKVSIGGTVMFDEYDSPSNLRRWPDAKPAIDAYLADKKFEIFERSLANRLIVRKKG